MNIATLLPSGEDRAVTLSELAERMGVSRREVEHAVQAARLAGEPIVTSQRGCWLSTDPDEVARAAESLNSRVVNQYRTVRAMRATARRMRAVDVHQETLFGEAA